MGISSPSSIHYETVFVPFQKLAEKAIQKHINSLNVHNRLHAAYAYALTTGGKRFRPAVVYMLADAIGLNYPVDQAALAIELCHTASLIADDLPCMDNDHERRSKPSLHRVFGETTALLASYAMIANAYAALAENAEMIKQAGHPASSDICVLALENAAYNTGLAGAVGGQFLDLNPPNFFEETLMEIIQKKTLSLFETAFVLGWLYGGGPIDKLPLVKQTAAHFGTAFQIVDDLQDLVQDKKHGQIVNYAITYGKDAARNLLQREMTYYRQSLDQLDIATEALIQLAVFLENLATIN